MRNSVVLAGLLGAGAIAHGNHQQHHHHAKRDELSTDANGVLWDVVMETVTLLPGESIPSSSADAGNPIKQIQKWGMPGDQPWDSRFNNHDSSTLTDSSASSAVSSISALPAPPMNASGPSFTSAAPASSVAADTSVPTILAAPASSPFSASSSTSQAAFQKNAPKSSSTAPAATTGAPASTGSDGSPVLTHNGISRSFLQSANLWRRMLNSSIPEFTYNIAYEADARADATEAVYTTTEYQTNSQGKTTSTATFTRGQGGAVQMNHDMPTKSGAGGQCIAGILNWNTWQSTTFTGADGWLSPFDLGFFEWICEHPSSKLPCQETGHTAESDPGHYNIIMGVGGTPPTEIGCVFQQNVEKGSDGSGMMTCDFGPMEVTKG